MATQALVSGVPASAIRVECSARSTGENVPFVAAMLASLKARRIAVLTHGLHLRQSCRAIVGLEYRKLPYYWVNGWQ